MNIHKWIYSKLSNAAAVTTIAGTRISPNIINEGDDLPAITYQTISADPQDTKDGNSALDIVTVDVDLFGEVFDTLQTLATAVNAAIERVTGTAESTTIVGCQKIGYRDDYSEVTQKGIFHIILTYNFMVKI